MQVRVPSCSPDIPVDFSSGFFIKKYITL